MKVDKMPSYVHSGNDDRAPLASSENACAQKSRIDRKVTRFFPRTYCVFVRFEFAIKSSSYIMYDSVSNNRFSVAGRDLEAINSFFSSPSRRALHPR
jgi:hypothetical protein